MNNALMERKQIRTYEEHSEPYGLTYGAWTVKWWQWALSTPTSINPVIDETGIKWNVNQPASDVWFLAGKFGSAEKNFPARKIAISSGRSILFPIINCEANPLEFPELTTPDDWVRHVVDDVNSVVKRNCFINGKEVNLLPSTVRSPNFSDINSRR